MYVPIEISKKLIKESMSNKEIKYYIKKLIVDYENYASNKHTEVLHKTHTDNIKSRNVIEIEDLLALLLLFY